MCQICVKYVSEIQGLCRGRVRDHQGCMYHQVQDMSDICVRYSTCRQGCVRYMNVSGMVRQGCVGYVSDMC